MNFKQQSRALRLSAVALAACLAASPAAFAQTSATGTVFGQVRDAAGTTIVIENLDNGARRTITPGADGKFQATSMAVGRYKVILMRAGAAVNTRDDVEVSIGQGTEVLFDANQLETVKVVGRVKTIDISNTGSTTTFRASELAKLPVANNVGAVIQLAPQTTRGDSRYGGGGAPSFGGASASENAYYINGFPVTTILTQVGFSQLPFNSIAQAQLLTGGYGAEFGRSTGGVVNLVTKSGGNDFAVGGQISFEPKSLRAEPKSSYYQNNGNATTDGKLRFYNKDNTQETTTTSLYASGPVIKDKLFFFVSAEQTKVDRSGIRIANNGGTGTTNSSNAGGWQETDITKNRGLVKLDWNITDSHHLEYTKIFDKVKDERRYYSFDYNTLQRGSEVTGGVVYKNWGPTPVAAEQGADVDILKYTGYLTDDLTITALIGQTKSPHLQTPSNYNPALPQIVATDGRIPGFTYPTPQTTVGNLLVPGANDKNKGGRFDVEWRVNSQHTLRAGLDYNKIQSVAGTSQAGGSVWTYGKTDPTVPLDTHSVATNTVTNNQYAQQGYYVQQSIISSQSTPTVIQSAEYIEDRYQITNNLLLSLGLRNEGFDNRNGDNVSYIKMTKQLAPRVGAAWDVNGDASFKVFSNAGRYHVPVPTNVAIRGAGSSKFTLQNFVYTGVDQATGAPTGTTQISPVFSNNNEFGQAKDPRQVAAQDMKGNYQDEFSAGFEKALSKSLTVGAKFTYRTLRTAIDDFCDDRPIRKWAAANSVTIASDWGFNCALFNPGRDTHLTLDLNNDGKLEDIHLSAADLGFPKVKRKYMALDLSAEYPFDGKLWGKVNYTWSRNNGNTEGQLLSDIGQGDVSTTQAFDFPDFSVNADGLLPNNRTHQIKAFGFYQVTPEWGVGGNALLSSGRPRNCIGNAPTGVPGVSDYSGYGSAYFFCDNKPSPRGSAGRLPWDIRFDMNLSYSPSVLPGFSVRVDVFNVFNRQAIETVEERYNAPGGSSAVWSRYGHVESYSAPRYVKFTASYDYKF